MRSKRGASIVLGLALAAGAWAAQEAPQRYRDTAGTYLAQVVGAARQAYPDAELISVSGRSDGTGSSVCDTKDPAINGWVYHFYSKKRDEAVLIAECQGYVVGPLKEFVSTAREAPPITGNFTDNDEAMKDLSDAGVSLDPADHGASGKRPFTFTLLNAEDDRFKKAPLFWQVTIGAESFMVNAIDHKLIRGVVVRYDRDERGNIIKDLPEPEGPTKVGGANMMGGSRGGATGATGRAKVPARPKRPRGYTAFRDLAKAHAYAKGSLPGAVLMGIDGIGDAWGNVDCFGSGDGWAYYFFWPKLKQIETIYSCNGEVGQGKAAYVPVSLKLHKQLPQFMNIDSDRAMDALLQDRSSVLNEGMGRYYTRRAPMRLLQFQSPPAGVAGAKATFLWEVSIGQSLYYLDAVTGKFVGEKK